MNDKCWASWIAAGCVNVRIGSGNKCAKSGTFTGDGISCSGFFAVCKTCSLPSTSVHSKLFLVPYTSKLSRYCRATSYRKRQMWQETSESLILMWHDSTANLLPDFFAMSSRTVPEPKQLT